MPPVILPRDSALYISFAELVQSADLVFFAGLPGVGKSLLLQQLALMAADAGRRVQLLQWDVARQPFETPRYPLQNGATHPRVIQAVGAWSRGAIVAWEAEFRRRGDLLIGEVPLIGGRLTELVKPAADAAEALLRGERARFVLPLPSREVRAAIEAKREQSIAAPRHENEAHDAPPDLLRALWRDLHQAGRRLGLVESADDLSYSPAIYGAVYRHLLRYRRVEQAKICRLLPADASVYSGLDHLPNLRATVAEAARILARLESSSAPETAPAWYDF